MKLIALVANMQLVLTGKLVCFLINLHCPAIQMARVRLYCWATASSPADQNTRIVDAENRLRASGDARGGRRAWYLVLTYRPTAKRPS